MQNSIQQSVAFRWLNLQTLDFSLFFAFPMCSIHSYNLETLKLDDWWFYFSQIMFKCQINLAIMNISYLSDLVAGALIVNMSQ